MQTVAFLRQLPLAGSEGPMRPVALVLACALARAAGVTWLHHSSQDEAAGVLPTDGGGGPWAPSSGEDR